MREYEEKDMREYEEKLNCNGLRGQKKKLNWTKK